jgi:hypothetical protein
MVISRSKPAVFQAKVFSDFTLEKSDAPADLHSALQSATLTFGEYGFWASRKTPPGSFTVITFVFSAFNAVASRHRCGANVLPVLLLASWNQEIPVIQQIATTRIGLPRSLAASGLIVDYGRRLRRACL